MADSSAIVCGLGMLTPVGINTKQACAALRAGVSAYEESAIYNKRFGPMTMALLPDDALPPLHEAFDEITGLTSRQTRMLRLAQPAMNEALGSLPQNQPVPLFLATPEALPGDAPVVSEEFLDHLILQTDADIKRSASRLFTSGRAAGMLAVQAALACLATSEHDYVLIGGVDSFLDLRLLSTLDQEDRVLAEGVMDGFAPGESAVFILLCAPDVERAPQNSPTIKLHYPGISNEPGHRYSAATYQGDGLANAVRLATSTTQGKPIRVIYSSMNGENFNAKEWGVAVARNSKAFDANYVLEHPADCVGDTGAASGPLLIAIAAEALGKKLISSPTLVCCSSDGAQRGALCLSS